MNKEILFIHGGQAFSRYENFLDYLRTTEIREPLGSPSKRWSHKLADDLGPQLDVYAPQMPNKQNAKYGEWGIWFERYLEFVHDGVTLVGWSQGGWFLVKYLLENSFPVQIGALYLVAAPFEADDFGGEDGGDFVFDTDLLPGSLANLKKIVIMHSKDDFVVPYEHALKYKKVLPQAELVTFEDRNHFLQEEFPELIDLIRGL